MPLNVLHPQAVWKRKNSALLHRQDQRRCFSVFHVFHSFVFIFDMLIINRQISQINSLILLAFITFLLYNSYDFEKSKKI